MHFRQCTPKKLHQGVARLCAKVRPGAAPVYVPVRPIPEGGATDCFLNVGKQVAAQGGSIVHGWRITELPGIFIEAEFHGIWRSPGGEQVDVTPSQNGDEQTLFLPDPEKTFDEAAFTRRDNVRLALKDHPVVHAFIAQAEEIYRYEEAHTNPRNPSQFVANEAEYVQMLERKLELSEELRRLPIGRNESCRCGSGLKYKKCCGK